MWNPRWWPPKIRINFYLRFRQEINEIPTTMFSKSSSPLALSVLLQDLTGGMKSKMASFKPEVPISQLVNNTGTKIQRLHPCFRGRTTWLDYCGDCLTCGFVRNQRWPPKIGSRYGITHISACIHNSSYIPSAMPMFSGSDKRLDYCEDCPKCGFVRNQRWRILTYSYS